MNLDDLYDLHDSTGLVMRDRLAASDRSWTATMRERAVMRGLFIDAVRLDRIACDPADMTRVLERWRRQRDRYFAIAGHVGFDLVSPVMMPPIL